MTRTRCVLFLPYFGEFNAYFPLFLRSCAANDLFEWVLFTDNDADYDYPPNIRIIKTTLEAVRALAERELGTPVCLKTPHKLCDLKPAYGLLFEEYLQGCEYWGYCDCDLIFGNLDKLLSPLMDEGYDKIFAAGHLTLYRCSEANNRRFMKPFRGKLLYKEAFASEKNYRFDEDYGESNVHALFIEDGARVFADDLSMNASIASAALTRDYYDPEKRAFVKEPYRKARFYWNDGDILSARWSDGAVCYDEYAYAHLQHRKMRMPKAVLKSAAVQILPDRFAPAAGVPRTRRELKLLFIRFPYLYWADTFQRKLIRKARACAAARGKGKA